MTNVGSHSGLCYHTLLIPYSIVTTRYIGGYGRLLGSRPVIQKRPINAQRDARPSFRDGKSFGAYTLFTPRVTRAMRKFREIRQIVPLACAAHRITPAPYTIYAMHACMHILCMYACMYTRGNSAARTPRRYHNPVTPNIDFDTYT